MFEIWYVVTTNLISLAALYFFPIWNSKWQPLRLEIKVCTIIQIRIILVVFVCGNVFFLGVCTYIMLTVVVGSEKTCSKIGKGKVSGSTSFRTMVIELPFYEIRSICFLLQYLCLLSNFEMLYIGMTSEMGIENSFSWHQIVVNWGRWLNCLLDGYVSRKRKILNFCLYFGVGDRVGLSLVWCWVCLIKTNCLFNN